MKKFKFFIIFLFALFSLNVVAEEKKETFNLLQRNRFPSTLIGDLKYKEALWPDPKSVLLSLGVKSDMIALDLCCGDGYFTIPLSKITYKTYGLELEPDLIELAIKKANQQKITTCEWIQGDARNLKNLIQQKVDFVLFANTFHGVPGKQSLISDIFSILKPGGQLAIINWCKKPKKETLVFGSPCGPKYEIRMSPEEVQEIVEPQGFQLKKIINFPPHHYGIIFEKICIK